MKQRLDDLLELSVRATNVLARENITTMAELLEYTPKQLLRMPNFGKMALFDLKEQLRSYGYYLVED